jgi:hypothetical protein
MHRSFRIITQTPVQKPRFALFAALPRGGGMMKRRKKKRMVGLASLSLSHMMRNIFMNKMVL